MTRPATTAEPIPAGHTPEPCTRPGSHLRNAGDTQVPIALGDVQVRPGAIVLADDDGMVVVPHHRLAEVTGLAAAIAEREDAITVPGETIAAARARYGYHALQREAS